MRLTLVERCLFANQFAILERLDPDSADHYALARRALESGFEIAYSWYMPITDGDDTMSVEAGHEVIAVLDMFRMLKSSYSAMDDKEGIDEEKLKYRGFDGNSETKQYAFALFLKKEGKWLDLEWTHGGNSHFPMLNTYRHMLRAWETSSDRYRLSKDDVLRIISHV